MRTSGSPPPEPSLPESLERSDGGMPPSPDRFATSNDWEAPPGIEVEWSGEIGGGGAEVLPARPEDNPWFRKVEMWANIGMSYRFCYFMTFYHFEVEQSLASTLAARADVQ